MIGRSRRILEASLGACVIYTVMAACNGGGGNQASGGHGGHGHGGAMAGPGGAMAGPGGSDGSGIMDALMDPVHDAMADPVSGTRLKASWIESNDGARQYLFNTEIDQDTGLYATTNIWFDSMRNEQCVFRLATDGKLRCLPGVLSYGAGRLGYSVQFSDAGCTMPVVAVSKSDINCAVYGPPAYALSSVIPANTCQTPGEDGMLHVYKVGAQTLPPASQLYAGNPPPLSCNAGNVASQYGAVYEATEVDPSNFAAVKTAVQHD